jgi:fimbrial chaperone protein
MGARGALGGLVCISLLTAAASAAAASFGLSPLGLSISGKETSASVIVTNTGTDEVAIQARPFAWSQNGQEQRAETRELLLNPPIFRLAPGEQQLVRVASRIAPLPETERAYRVVFSEVPPAATGSQGGFRITLAMDIPVYIEPLQQARPSIAWRWNGNALVADNSGGKHFRLREVEFLDGSTPVHSIPRIVVLARSWLQIEMPDSARRARGLRLIGQDDADQRISIEIPASAAQ